MTAAGKLPSRKDAGFALAAVGALFVALVLKTWLRWPALIVDFGAQLYIPWQLSKGAVLYRDVAYLPGGPLSQYYHALLFKLCGVSFLTIVISNLVVVTLLLALLYVRFYRCSDQLTALAVCISVLAVFAFAEYTITGIFNYITPYSAEAVHGLLLSVFAVALLARWIETEQPRVAAMAGLCCGLTLLTKPDMFLALALTFVAAAFVFWQTRRNAKLLARSIAFMVLAGIIPSAVFFLWFVRSEPFGDAARAVVAAWIPLFTSHAANSPFYQWCLGLDMPLIHLRHAAAQFLWLAGVATVCALVCLKRIRGIVGWVLPAAAGSLLVRAAWDFNWFHSGRPLLLVSLSLLVLLLRRMAKTGWEPGLAFPVLWTFWGLVLLAKLGFFWRIWHYGFVLAMPAFVSGILLFLWMLPQELEGWVRPGAFRALLALLLLTGVGRLTQASLVLYSDKTLPIGSGSDTILAYDSHFVAQDAETVEAWRWIEKNVPTNATLTVMPQGALLNYLSRHTNPCGYGAWNPPEIAAFGQEKMTAAFIRHSPDYVVLIAVNYREYGEDYFGVNKRFGGDVMKWIEAHYQPVWHIGHAWLKDRQFGIKILKKQP